MEPPQAAPKGEGERERTESTVWRRGDLASKRSDEYGKVTHLSVILSTKKLRLDLFYRSVVAVSFWARCPLG